MQELQNAFWGGLAKWSISGALPEDITLGPTGRLVGRPSAVGKTDITLVVEGPDGPKAEQRYSLTIAPDTEPVVAEAAFPALRRAFTTATSLPTTTNSPADAPPSASPSPAIAPPPAPPPKRSRSSKPLPATAPKSKPPASQQPRQRPRPPRRGFTLLGAELF